MARWSATFVEALAEEAAGGGDEAVFLPVLPVGEQGRDDVVDLELVGADGVAPPGDGDGHQDDQDAHGEPGAGEPANCRHRKSDDAATADGAPPTDGRTVTSSSTISISTDRVCSMRYSLPSGPANRS